MSISARRLTRGVRTSGSGGNAGPRGAKPTDSSTGPRLPLLTTSSDTYVTSGSYSQVHFTLGVGVEGAVTFTDCRFEAGIQILDGPVVIDQCDINGWFGVTTNNTDSNKPPTA